MNEPSFRFPLNRALLYIFLSTLFISGSGFMGWLYYLHLKQLRLQDERYNILGIIQTCKQRYPLKTAYLAELMGLLPDKPCNLYRFNLKRAEERMLSAPLLKTVKLQKIPPSYLELEYTMKEPLFYVIDFENTAMDEEGVLIPVEPFFPKQELPAIYLGLTPERNRWGQKIDEAKVALALEILEEGKKVGEKIKRIDLSQAFAKSWGCKEIILTIEKTDKQLAVLRLNTKEYSANLRQFVILRDYLEQESRARPWIIDFRIPQLAFLRERERR